MLPISLFFMKLAGLVKTAYGMKTLEMGLRPYFSDKILAQLKLEPLEQMLYNYTPSTADPGQMTEDIVDMVLDRRKGYVNEFQGAIAAFVQRKYGIEDLDDAFRTVKSGGDLGTKEFQEIARVLGDLIHRRLRDRALNWVELHKRIEKKKPKNKVVEDATGEGYPSKTVSVDIAVPPDADIKEMAEQEHGWKPGFIERALHIIDWKGGDKAKIWKKVLTDMFIEGKPQTEIAKELGVDTGNMSRYITELKEVLRPWAKEQGFGGKDYLKQIEEDGQEEKTEKAERREFSGNYQKVLSDPEKSKEFIEYFKENGPKLRADSAKAKIILDVLCAGGSTDEAAEKSGTDKKGTFKVKNRYFDEHFHNWMKEQGMGSEKTAYESFSDAPYKLASKIVEASYDSIEGAPFKIAVKTVRVDFPGEEHTQEDEEAAPGDVTKIHEKMADKFVKNDTGEVTIEFSSEGTTADVVRHALRKEEFKHDFKWLYYTFTIDAERAAGKRTKAILYTYEESLTPDGKFSGDGKSTLFVDFSKHHSVGTDLQKTLDEYVKTRIKPKGVLPHDLTVHYKNTNPNVSKHNRTDVPGAWQEGTSVYHGIEHFIENHRGVAISDEPHKKLIKDWEDLQINRMLGTSDLARAKAQIVKMKNDLKAITDPKEKEEIEAQLKTLEKVFKDRKQIIQDLGEESAAKKFREMREESPQSVAATEDVNFVEKRAAFPFPPPKDKDIVDFLKQLDEKYRYKTWTPSEKATTGGFGALNPEGYMNHSDLIGFSRLCHQVIKKYYKSVNSAITKNPEYKGKKKEEKTKLIEQKKKEMSEEESSILQQLVSAIDKYPEDLTARLDEMKTTDPQRFERFAEKHDIRWLDKTEPLTHEDKAGNKTKWVDKARSLAKHHAIHGEDPVGKPEKSIQMIEKRKFDNIKTWVAKERTHFGIYAERLSTLSLDKFGAPSSEEKSSLEQSMAESQAQMNKFLLWVDSIKEKMDAAVVAKKAEISPEDKKEIEKIDKAMDALKATAADIKARMKEIDSIREEMPAEDYDKMAGGGTVGPSSPARPARAPDKVIRQEIKHLNECFVSLEKLLEKGSIHGVTTSLGEIIDIDPEVLQKTIRIIPQYIIQLQHNLETKEYVAPGNVSDPDRGGTEVDIQDEYGDKVRELDELAKELDGLTKKKEGLLPKMNEEEKNQEKQDLDEISLVQGALREARSLYNTQSTRLKKKGESPAKHYAEQILYKLDDFAKLYSTLASFLWMRMRSEPGRLTLRLAGDAAVESSMRERAVKNLLTLAAVALSNRGAVDSQIKDTKKALESFIGISKDSGNSKDPGNSIEASLPYNRIQKWTLDVYASGLDGLDSAIHSIFDKIDLKDAAKIEADLKANAAKASEQLKKSKTPSEKLQKSVATWMQAAQQAETELKDIIDSWGTVHKTFEDAESPAIKALVEKLGGPEKALKDSGKKRDFETYVSHFRRPENIMKAILLFTDGKSEQDVAKTTDEATAKAAKAYFDQLYTNWAIGMSFEEIQKLGKAHAKADLNKWMYHWQSAAGHALHKDTGGNAFLPEDGEAKDKSLRGLHPSKYQTLIDFVKETFPKIKEVPEVEEASIDLLKMPKPLGKATPENIRTKLENDFLRGEKPKDITNVHYKKEPEDEVGGEPSPEKKGKGGGGGSGRSRPKPIKLPLPRYTASMIKDDVSRMFRTDKSAEEIVDKTLDMYMAKVKSSSQLTELLHKEGLSGGEAQLAVYQIVSGAVDFLHSLDQLINGLDFRSARVKSPQGLKMKFKPDGEKVTTPGQDKSDTLPDVPIDSEEEAKKAWETIQNVHKNINQWFSGSGDEVGIPTDKPSKTRKIFNKMPYSLSQTLESFKEDTDKPIQPKDPSQYQTHERLPNNAEPLPESKPIDPKLQHFFQKSASDFGRSGSDDMRWLSDKLESHKIKTLGVMGWLEDAEKQKIFDPLFKELERTGTPAKDVSDVMNAYPEVFQGILKVLNKGGQAERGPFTHQDTFGEFRRLVDKEIEGPLHKKKIQELFLKGGPSSLDLLSKNPDVQEMLEELTKTHKGVVYTPDMPLDNPKLLEIVNRAGGFKKLLDAFRSNKKWKNELKELLVELKDSDEAKAAVQDICQKNEKAKGLIGTLEILDALSDAEQKSLHEILSLIKKDHSKRAERIQELKDVIDTLTKPDSGVTIPEVYEAFRRHTRKNEKVLEILEPMLESVSTKTSAQDLYAPEILAALSTDDLRGVNFGLKDLAKMKTRKSSENMPVGCRVAATFTENGGAVCEDPFS